MSFIFLTSCSTFLKWQTESPDNFLEEAVEDIIKEKTGKDIDLTPITGKETQKIRKKNGFYL